MKTGDRVVNPDGELATVLQVGYKGVRLRFDKDVEFAKKHGISNSKAEKMFFDPQIFKEVV